LAADVGVVALEELAPATVTLSRRVLGGADDVGEEHRGEHAVGPGRPPGSGEELLDLVQERIRISEEDDVVVSGELDEHGVRHGLAEPAAHADRNDRVAHTVQEERRGLDRRRNGTYVVLPKDLSELAKAPLLGDQALESGPPPLVALVPRL